MTFPFDAIPKTEIPRVRHKGPTVLNTRIIQATLLTAQWPEKNAFPGALFFSIQLQTTYWLPE